MSWRRRSPVCPHSVGPDGATAHVRTVEGKSVLDHANKSITMPRPICEVLGVERDDVAS